MADGGKWYVHGMTLQLEYGDQQGLPGPPGYVGTMTWNEYANRFFGTVHLTLVHQADGSLLGTVIDNPTWSGTAAEGEPGGMTGQEPKKGDVMRLVPVAPMHAKIVHVSGSADMYTGNTNICQLGLPDASQYCGA